MLQHENENDGGDDENENDGDDDYGFDSAFI